MSHHRYETKGFILGRRPYGESALLLSVLSRDFGLVPVLAQGAREERSKHRMALSAHQPVSISLVRGREWWRLVGVKSDAAPGAVAKKKLLERLATIIRHYVHGELPEPALFAVLNEAWELSEDVLNDNKRLLRVECILAARLLLALGYLDLPSDWGKTMPTKELLSAINDCLARGIA